MVCPSCGWVLQSNADACVNVGCAAYQVPLAAEARVATRPRPDVPSVPMHPLDTLARVVSAVIAVVAVLGSASTLLALHDYATVAERSAAGILALFGGVCFVAWLYRARRNLDPLIGADPTWSPAWTIASWFIPVANIVLPGFVVSEVAKESVPPADEEGRRQVTVIARVWWVLAVVALLSYSDSIDTPDKAGPAYLTVGTLLASGAAGIVLVRKVTAVQAGRYSLPAGRLEGGVVAKIKD
jgi:hypothetical protein